MDGLLLFVFFEGVLDDFAGFLDSGGLEGDVGVLV